MKFQIDAGHGPNTAGKRCPDDSMREYHFNSVTARYLAEELSKYEGVEIRMNTFSDASDVPINTRYRLANQWPADCFISIHANAFGDDWNDAHGIETLVDANKSKASVALAVAVQRKLVAATGLTDRSLKYVDNIGVLKYTNMTAILVECGFMSNKKEAELLKSDAYRRKCACAIASGIVECYGLNLKAGQAPTPQHSKEEKVMVTYHGNKIADGFLRDGVTYIPARTVEQLSGKKIVWDNKTREVRFID